MGKLHQHTGKLGIYMNKTKTSDLVYKAVENYTDSLVQLVQDKVVPNTQLSEEVLLEIKHFFLLHFVAITDKLLKSDNIDNKASNEVYDKSTSFNPPSVNINIARWYKVTITKASNDFSEREYSMLNFHMENLFAIPFFLSLLSMEDRQKATEITVHTIKEMEKEVKDSLYYKTLFNSLPAGQRGIIMEVAEAREEFVKKNKRMPFTKEIAAIIRPGKHKNTLNSEIRKLNLSYDYKTGDFTDRKLKKKLK